MSVNLPETPKPDEIQAEMTALKRRMAELRALLRFSEARELAAKVHRVNRHTKEGQVSDGQ